MNYELTQTFGETPEGAWLQENAETYGFVLSYPDGKEAEMVTGYLYEPWHWRFVGTAKTAREFNKSDMYLNKWLLTQGN